MRWLVCGGRDHADPQALFAALGEIARQYGKHPDWVIAGGAKGADTAAHDWATVFGIPCRVFRADWAKYGKGAGPIRNQQMLDEGKPDLVIAFPTGRLAESKGTKSMVTKAVIARVPVVVVEEGRFLTHDGHPFRFPSDG